MALGMRCSAGEKGILLLAGVGVLWVGYTMFSSELGIAVTTIVSIIDFFQNESFLMFLKGIIWYIPSGNRTVVSALINLYRCGYTCVRLVGPLHR